MKSGEAVLLLVCLVFAGIILGEYMSTQEHKIYMCSEVTKDSPADVKKICGRRYGY